MIDKQDDAKPLDLGNKLESKHKVEALNFSPQSERQIKATPFECLFVNRKDCEEETEICKIIMLESSIIKRVTIVPLLTLLTAGFILLFSYWSVSLTLALFYSKTERITKATHLLIHGTRNQKEIVKL